MDNRIFWSDREKDTIETIKPDKTDRQVVAKSKLQSESKLSL